MDGLGHGRVWVECVVGVVLVVGIIGEGGSKEVALLGPFNP